MKQSSILIKNDCFRLSLINGAKLVGVYDYPELKPTNTIVNSNEILPFNYALSCKTPEKYFVHFYLDDYQFERLWQKPHYYLNLLKRFKGVIAPDFSVYTDMPRAMQIWNIYKNRVLSYFYQQNGITVVPNVSWAKYDSFNFCFDSLPKNSTVAVSSVGCMKNPQAVLNFCLGFEEMQKVLKPTQVIFFGKVPESLKKYNNILPIQTYYKKFD